MHDIEVSLDLGDPDLTIIVRAPEGRATVQWLKEELCRQDPTGDVTPRSFRVSAACSPEVVLPGTTEITTNLGRLFVQQGTDEAAVEGEKAEAVETPEPDLALIQEKAAEEERRSYAIEQAARVCAMEEARRLRSITAAPAPAGGGYWKAAAARWRADWYQGSVSEYTFRLEDPSWAKYLKRHGFCVLADVLPEDDLRMIEEQFWSEIAHIVPGLRRNDPSTWNFPGQQENSTGIVRGYGLPQSQFAWAVRSHPRIASAFERIFGTRDLAVSLDSVKLVGSGVQDPGTLWLHRDQLLDVNLYSVQSIYSFYDVGPENDGTILIPGSHKRVYEWDARQKTSKGAIVSMLRADGREKNNVRVPSELQESLMATAIKPRVPPNGLILFNSRTIHASAPDPGARWVRDRAKAMAPRPNRVAVSVAMCPKARRGVFAALKKLELIEKQGSATHWADDEILTGQLFDRLAGESPGSDFQHLPQPKLKQEPSWQRCI